MTVGESFKFLMAVRKYVLARKFSSYRFIDLWTVEQHFCVLICLIDANDSNIMLFKLVLLMFSHRFNYKQLLKQLKQLLRQLFK